MTVLRSFHAHRGDWYSSCGREQRLKDYIALVNQLVFKRQGSFFAAAVLCSFYFDPVSIFATYAVVALTEMLDMLLGRQFRGWDGENPLIGRQICKRIALNTAVSAAAISVFIINIAMQQSGGGHFTPLFLLFSASIFAAMYNSQMMGILLLRLSIYGFTFIYIALIDVVRYTPPIRSAIWLEFFTIMFVLYFIIDIAVKFYLDYQQRLEQLRQIREENRRAMAALEVKSQFLATVSHELRTPLTSIIGSLDLIRNEAFGPMPKTFAPAVNIAARNSHRLKALIEDLLDLQKIEAGEMQFKFEPLNVNHLMREAVESADGYASKHGIALTLEPSEDSAWITGDRDRLIQVMNNLLSNAIKFSHAGGTVRVSSRSTDTKVRIEVTDTGSGIPPGSKDRVFGRFTQVDSSDVRKIGGTGLGLNISKQIMGHHHGLIDYESELGIGSTFHIEMDRLTLP